MQSIVVLPVLSQSLGWQRSLLAFSKEISLRSRRCWSLVDTERETAVGQNEQIKSMLSTCMLTSALQTKGCSTNVELMHAKEDHLDLVDKTKGTCCLKHHVEVGYENPHVDQAC